MLDTRLFPGPGATSTAIWLDRRFSRTNHSSSYASLTAIGEALKSTLRKGNAMLGPSLSDWPIRSRRSSTVEQPPGDIRLSRYDLALACYLEQQEAHRAAIMASRQHAQIRLGTLALLRLSRVGRFLKRTAPPR